MSFFDENEITVEFHDREHLAADSVFLELKIFVRATENAISGKLAQRTDFSFQIDDTPLIPV